MEPVETIKRLLDLKHMQGKVQEWRHNTPLLTQALRAASREQAQQLAKEIWRESQHQAAGLLLGQLSASVPGAVSKLTAEFLDARYFSPGWIFIGAGEHIVRRMLSLLNDPIYQEYRNLLLICLVWIGSDRVQSEFVNWRTTPPIWSSEIYNPLERYPIEAGWELTPEGRRRDLYWHLSYDLEVTNESVINPDNKAALVVSTPHEGRCGWCNRPLVTVLDIDLSDYRCADVIGKGTQLRVAECQWCSTYATTYTDIDLNGKSTWSDLNGSRPAILDRIPDDGMMPDLEPRQLSVLSRRRTPFETLGRFRLDETGISQLGGHPEWIQRTFYPKCPSCGKHMQCVGQVAWEEIYESGDGISYAFLCLECGKAATKFQQT